MKPFARSSAKTKRASTSTSHQLRPVGRFGGLQPGRDGAELPDQALHAPVAELAAIGGTHVEAVPDGRELALPAFGGRHSRSIVGGEAVCCNGLLIRGRQVTCQSSSGTAPL